jgi:hypothetical protein
VVDIVEVLLVLVDVDDDLVLVALVDLVGEDEEVVVVEPPVIVPWA